MAQYYRTNAIYEALNNIEHDFQWVSGNAWLLVYGNKSDHKAKVLVLVHGTSWKIQTEIINTLQYITKKLNIPVYKIIFDDSHDDSISEVVFCSSLKDEGKMYFLGELKSIFKNAGLDIIDGKCDKYLNDKTSSAYHKWQRFSLGNKIVVSDLDLIRMSKSSKEPIEFIELKRSTADVNIWKPYIDDYANFNLINSISQRTNIPLLIVYNRMVKDIKTKTIIDDIHNPVSIFLYTQDNCKVISRNCNFNNFVKGIYKEAKVTITQETRNICNKCKKDFTPKFLNASLCIDCWKKEQGY